MTASLIRVLFATGIAIALCMIIVGVLMLLPGWCSLAVMFVGLVAFMTGGELERKWIAVTGGILMFSGVFAAAMLGVLK